MRRLFSIIAMALVVALAAPTAGAGAATDLEALKAARNANWFYFGSSVNPLLNRTCGRVVGGRYVLPAPTGQDLELSCTVPKGVPLTAYPNGAIAWAPTDGETGAELLASRDRYLASVFDPETTVDGKPQRIQVVRSAVYPLQLRPGNFIQTIDHLVEGTSTLVATGSYLSLLPPLSLGRHEVFLRSMDDDLNIYDITLHLTVR